MKLTINDHKHHFDSDGESLCCFTHSKTVKIDPLSAHTDFTSGFSATNNPSARMNLYPCSVKKSIMPISIPLGNESIK